MTREVHRIKPAGKYPTLRPKYTLPKPKSTIAVVTSGYKPTEQKTGKWRMVRGNAPGKVNQKEWVKAFNKMDDRCRKKNMWSTERSEQERESGRIRKAAILDLIARKKLPVDFEDTKP